MQYFSLRIFLSRYLWSSLLWLFLASSVTAEQSVPTNPPCADWNQRFQQPLPQDVMPEPLRHLFTSQKGRGFTASFTEEKRLTVLRTPLTSSGQLTFIPPYGLYRQLQKPFSQEMLITPDAIHQRTASDRPKVLALDALPGAKALVAAFLALFSGSWDALHTHFQVYFAQDGAQWSLGLKPTHEATAKMIACLTLEGQQQQLVALRVQETNGDVTYDRFLDPHLVPEAEWAKYQSQFAQFN